jgi:hypothetical protein
VITLENLNDRFLIKYTISCVFIITSGSLFFLFSVVFLCSWKWRWESSYLFSLHFFLSLRWALKIWYVSTLPIHNDGFRDIIDVRLATPQEFASTLSYLFDKVLVVDPVAYSIDIIDVFAFGLFKNCIYVGFRVGDSLGTDNRFKDLVGFCLALIINDTWAIDQINTLCQRDVLPDFGLSGDGGHLTNGFPLECIYD